MKNNYKFMFILCLLAAGCSSLPQSQKLTTKSFDLILLGQNKDAVRKLLGPASELRTSIENEELWIYNLNDKEQTQVATVAFNLKTSQVTSKTVVPQENEPENDLDFVIHKKFNAFQFEEVPRQRCRKDYLPSESFYISSVGGVVVEYHKQDKAVTSISWTSPEYAASAAKKIKNCEL